MTTNSPLMNNSPTPNTEGLAIGLSVAASVLGLALMSVIVAVIALVMLKRYRGEYRVSQHTESSRPQEATPTITPSHHLYESIGSLPRAEDELPPYLFMQPAQLAQPAHVNFDPQINELRAEPRISLLALSEWNATRAMDDCLSDVDTYTCDSEDHVCCRDDWIIGSLRAWEGEQRSEVEQSTEVEQRSEVDPMTEIQPNSSDNDSDYNEQWSVPTRDDRGEESKKEKEDGDYYVNEGLGPTRKHTQQANTESTHTKDATRAPTVPTPAEPHPPDSAAIGTKRRGDEEDDYYINEGLGPKSGGGGGRSQPVPRKEPQTYGEDDYFIMERIASTTSRQTGQECVTEVGQGVSQTQEAGRKLEDSTESSEELDHVGIFTSRSSVLARSVHAGRINVSASEIAWGGRWRSIRQGRCVSVEDVPTRSRTLHTTRPSYASYYGNDTFRQTSEQYRHGSSPYDGTWPYSRHTYEPSSTQATKKPEYTYISAKDSDDTQYHQRVEDWMAGRVPPGAHTTSRQGGENGDTADTSKGTLV